VFLHMFEKHVVQRTQHGTTPDDVLQCGALQLLLQEVAWDEASRKRKRAERAAIMAQYEDIGDLQHEPLFCAETALKVDPAFEARHVTARHDRAVQWLHPEVGGLIYTAAAPCMPRAHRTLGQPNGLVTWGSISQAFHWAFLSYRFEEHAGADVEAADSPGDPDALEARAADLMYDGQSFLSMLAPLFACTSCA
jgi:hypothetical protein